MAIIVVALIAFGLYKLFESIKKDNAAASEDPEDKLLKDLPPFSAKCDNCGATISPTLNDRIVTHCPYCGADLPEMSEQVRQAIEFNRERQRHVMQMERADNEIRKEKAKHFGSQIELIKWIVIGLIFLPFILLLLKAAFI